MSNEELDYKEAEERRESRREIVEIIVYSVAAFAIIQALFFVGISILRFVVQTNATVDNLKEYKERCVQNVSVEGKGATKISFPCKSQKL